MRKIIVLVAVCVLVLTACSGSENNINVESTDEQSKSAETQKPHGDVEFRDKGGNVLLTIEDIANVYVTTSENAEGIIEYNIRLLFTEDGAKKFEDITAGMVGEKMAIYVGDELVSNPVVNSAIKGGEAYITGMFSYEEAEEIVNKIMGSNNDNNEQNTSQEKVRLKITENDGTILVTQEQIDTFSVVAMPIGKGGSDVEVIVIEFTEEGKEIMAKKTKKLVGKEINLVVNGKLLYDCRLDEMISDGRWILTGFDSMAEIYKITNELEGVIN